MNRNDIIRMAREAELGVVLTADESVDGEGGVWLDADVNYIKQIERFFHAAYTAGAAAEREACVKVCDEIEKRKWLIVQNGGNGARDCAAAIRARGEK